ncbi:MAG: hypothetical protein PF447_06905 [Spirochaetaceae bacterium]|jgi:hypothetical protein|nr:hypothetical protein [Spirochaetaceae bacterium]
MILQDILTLVKGKLICGEDLQSKIDMICSSDLMSDILTLEPENALMVTGLANIQAIRTAEMADIDFILLVREKEITQDMQSLAKESGIILMQTAMGMYEACGVLYAQGLKSGYNHK